MHAYVRDLKTLFLKHANPRNAGPMKRYMRDQFEYVGLKGPEFGALLRQHIASHGLPDLADLERILRDLWSLPQREFQYAATSLLRPLRAAASGPLHPHAGILDRYQVMVGHGGHDRHRHPGCALQALSEGARSHPGPLAQVEELLVAPGLHPVSAQLQTGNGLRPDAGHHSREPGLAGVLHQQGHWLGAAAVHAR